MMLEFPRIEQIDTGFRVRTSQGSFLPGIYKNFIMAQKHMERYMSQSRTVKAKRKQQAAEDK